MKNIAAKSFANIAAMLHYFLQINMPISDYGAMHFNNWRLIYLETVTEKKKSLLLKYLLLIHGEIKSFVIRKENVVPSLSKHLTVPFPSNFLFDG